jgi:hypothetical protein
VSTTAQAQRRERAPGGSPGAAGGRSLATVPGLGQGFPGGETDSGRLRLHFGLFESRR